MKKNWSFFLVGCMMSVYIFYFSFFCILRMRTLYAHYYDLGIMHQTVYNTYQGIRTGDLSRILEMTDTERPIQIKRMAVHNDILLAALSPFYFIYSGPETLLVIQSFILGLGALAVFLIAREVFQKNKHKETLGILFALSYLLYPSMERSNMFDFHPVVLATTFLLFMFYFFMKKKYAVSFIFIILSLLSKEQVGLTIAFFGLYSFWTGLREADEKVKRKTLFFAAAVFIVGVFWFAVSLGAIIPYFRGGNHFALGYYGDFGDSPSKIIIGVLENPISLSHYILRADTFTYFLNAMGPVGFLSIFSPLTFFIALPEYAINLLSNNPNMRNIIYQYTAVITPFMLISGIYGSRYIIYFQSKIKKIKNISVNVRTLTICIWIILFSILFSIFKGPLPWAPGREVHPFLYPQKEARDVASWAKVLADEKLKISATGHVAPFFTNRRYFYLFSDRYSQADYVVIALNEVFGSPEKNVLIPVYSRLRKDPHYRQIYENNKLQIYKRI